MPEENVDMVRRCFDAFARHDVDSLIELVDPEVEIRSLMTEAERTMYRGRRGAREWFEAVLDIFPDWRPTPQRVTDCGNGAVLVAFDVTATAAGSGVPIDHCYYQAARVRRGRMAWFGFFRTESDARRALGLEDHI
jgi:ketosteroid isomerase-like protein